MNTSDRPVKSHVLDPVQTVRRDRLQQLISVYFFGTAAHLARRVKRKPSQISGMLNAERPFGEHVARAIEKELALPRFYLDHEGPVEPVAGSKLPPLLSSPQAAPAPTAAAMQQTARQFVYTGVERRGMANQHRVPPSVRKLPHPHEHVAAEVSPEDEATGTLKGVPSAIVRGLTTGDIVAIPYLEEDELGLPPAGPVPQGMVQMLTKSWLDRFVPNRTAVENLKLAVATNDSMGETFGEGSFLLVDVGETSIEGEGIFYMNYKGTRLINRVQRDLSDGGVAILSDNPRYREQKIQPEGVRDLRVVGKVRGTWPYKPL